MGGCLNAPTTCLVLRGGVMLNNPQQRKALVLSLLMVMLAQTAYMQALRGWTYPPAELASEDSPTVAWTSPPPGDGLDNLDLRLHLCLLYTSDAADE